MSIQLRLNRTESMGVHVTCRVHLSTSRWWQRYSGLFSYCINMFTTLLLEDPISPSSLQFQVKYIFRGDAPLNHINKNLLSYFWSIAVFRFPFPLPRFTFLFCGFLLYAETVCLGLSFPSLLLLSHRSPRVYVTWALWIWSVCSRPQRKCLWWWRNYMVTCWRWSSPVRKADCLRGSLSSSLHRFVCCRAKKGFAVCTVCVVQRIPRCWKRTCCCYTCETQLTMTSWCCNVLLHTLCGVLIRPSLFLFNVL